MEPTEITPPRSQEYLAELFDHIQDQGSCSLSIGASAEQPTIRMNDVRDEAGLRLQFGVDVEAMRALLTHIYESGDDLVELVDDYEPGLS